MTSLRERVRRWFRPNPGLPPDAAPFSFRVFWTREVRAWDLGRRDRVQAAVAFILESPDFVANEGARRYRVPELDSTGHSGASLVALDVVLTAFARQAGQEANEVDG